MNSEEDHEYGENKWDPSSEFDSCIDGFIHRFFHNRVTGTTECLICDRNILDCKNEDKLYRPNIAAS